MFSNHSFSFMSFQFSLFNFQFGFHFGFKSTTWSRQAIWRDSIILWPKSFIKTLKLKFSGSVSLAKFQSAMGALQHPALVGNCQTLQPNVFALSLPPWNYNVIVPCSNEWYITCPFWVVCGARGLLLWF